MVLVFMCTTTTILYTCSLHDSLTIATELEHQAKLIRDEREVLLKRMSAIPGLQVFPSQANFILFRVLDKNANDVFESIKKSGVLIKNMKADDGLLANCLRVTVGTPDENRTFVGALGSAMNNRV